MMETRGIAQAAIEMRTRRRERRRSNYKDK